MGGWGGSELQQTTHTIKLGDITTMTRRTKTHWEWKHMLRTAAALDALKAIERQHFSVCDDHTRAISLYTYWVARDWKSLDT